MKVRTVSKTEVDKIALRASRESSEALVSMFSRRHQFCFKSSSLVAQPIDALRWFTELTPNSSKTLHIRNIMVNALSDSEGIQGSSAVVCAAALPTFLHLPNLNNADALDRVKEDLRAISQLSRRCTSDDLFDIIRSLDSDPFSSRLTIESLKRCAPNSSLSVLKEGNQTLIRNTSGYKFPARCSEQFISSAGARGDISIENPRVFVIDGTIEEMSEIDGIVSKSYESKTALVIVARGFSSDVTNTLGVNFYHGHLKVIPVTVPYDELGANLINDICVSCGSDLVSSFKGDLISSKKWEEIRSVDCIKVHTDRNFITVFTESTADLVRRHRASLGKKIASSSSSLETEVLERRISCLSGNGVEVLLGSDICDKRGVYSDRIGSHIRNFRSGAKWGIIDLNSANTKKSLSYPTRDVIKMLSSISSNFTSPSLIVGIRSALSCARSIKSLGGIIYSDD